MLTYVFLFECLQAIDSSFATITKPLSNKTRKTFCEGLKLMCNVFEINTQRDFQNLLFFFKSAFIFCNKNTHTDIPR